MTTQLTKMEAFVTENFVTENWKKDQLAKAEKLLRLQRASIEDATKESGRSSEDPYQELTLAYIMENSGWVDLDKELPLTHAPRYSNAGGCCQAINVTPDAKAGLDFDEKAMVINRFVRLEQTQSYVKGEEG